MIGRLATFVAGLVYTLLYTNKWPPYSNALYRLGSKQFYIGLGAICFVVKWARSVECDALSVALFSSLLPLQSLIRLCCLMEDLVMNDYGAVVAVLLLMALGLMAPFPHFLPKQPFQHFLPHPANYQAIWKPARRTQQK